MEKEEKKTISFGFSKLQKVSIIGSKLPPKSEDAVQFIDCLENKSIKMKIEEPKKSVLVIPLNRPDSHSIVQSRIVGRQLKSTETSITNDASETSRNDSTSSTQTSTSKDVSNSGENVTENLDQLAAKEILEDLKKSQEKKEESSTFSVPLSSAPVSEKESTLDDYDNIPITEFGMAMLRGMGWKPGKGIGKNEQLVSAKPPISRPKGLGLGADKVIQPEKTSETKEEVLKLVKGSYIRIIAGSHKDLFGEIMGFDEETGRLIAKMAISGSVLTFNEFMVKAVNKDEYNKNSKVLNVKKYEEFKEKENAGEDPNDIIESMKNKASKSTTSRHSSDTRRREQFDRTDDSHHDSRRDRHRESRNRSSRQRSNSHSDDSTSRRSHLKDRKYEKRRSPESDSDSNTRRHKYSKSDRDRTNTHNKRNLKTKENRSETSEDESEREIKKTRRGKRSSSISDEDNQRSMKKHRSSQHSTEGRRKKKSRQASSSSSSEDEEDYSHRRKKNDKEVIKKVSKSVKDYKSHRVDGSYSKERNKSKKSSRKYSSSIDSSTSEEESTRSSKKSKKRHKKKHHRSRSSS